MTESERTGWVVWVNTDLTEGRGWLTPKHVCDLEATAQRLAKGADVQGCDARIQEVSLMVVDRVVYGPVWVVRPTEEDARSQRAIDAARIAEAKAKEAGLTDADLAAIRATAWTKRHMS